MRRNLADELLQAVNAPGTELARAALVIARIEFPRLDPEPYLMRLDAMGEAARTAIANHYEATGDHTLVGAIKSINRYLFVELGFEGIQASPRHKSGIAVRFPRILRWRKDKSVEDADTMEILRALLEAAR
jgi:hypothetical protein